MKEIIKLGFSLFLFCAVAALSLAFTNEMTKDTISAQREATELAAKQAVLMEADEFKKIEEENLKKIKESHPIIEDVSIGLKDGNNVGYVIKTSPVGYGGPITVITGINQDGIITGVRIAKHSESPGLGSKSTEEKFYLQYNDKTAETVSVNKESATETEIKAISAATITSVAVTSGVNESGKILPLINKN